MATYRVYHRSGSGAMGEPKTRLIRAESLAVDEQGNLSLTAKNAQGYSETVALFCGGYWTHVRKVRGS